MLASPEALARAFGIVVRRDRYGQVRRTWRQRQSIDNAEGTARSLYLRAHIDTATTAHEEVRGFQPEPISLH